MNIAVAGTGYVGLLAQANREINRFNSRPAPASDRENYIIGEMDLINRQLESEF